MLHEKSSLGLCLKAKLFLESARQVCNFGMTILLLLVGICSPHGLEIYLLHRVGTCVLCHMFLIAILKRTFGQFKVYPVGSAFVASFFHLPF